MRKQIRNRDADEVLDGFADWIQSRAKIADTITIKGYEYDSQEVFSLLDDYLEDTMGAVTNEEFEVFENRIDEGYRA